AQNTATTANAMGVAKYSRNSLTKMANNAFMPFPQRPGGRCAARHQQVSLPHSGLPVRQTAPDPEPWHVQAWSSGTPALRGSTLVSHEMGQTPLSLPQSPARLLAWHSAWPAVW